MTNREILIEVLTGFKNAIVQNMHNENAVATGKTINAFEIIANEYGGKLIGASWIYHLEHGRGPTKSSTPSNPTLLEAIKQWITAKGLDLNPYAVAKKIHKFGTKLYREGKTRDIYTSIINDDKRIQEAFEKLANNYLVKINNEKVINFQVNGNG